MGNKRVFGRRKVMAGAAAATGFTIWSQRLSASMFVETSDKSWPLRPRWAACSNSQVSCVAPALPG